MNPDLDEEPGLDFDVLHLQLLIYLTPPPSHPPICFYLCFSFLEISNREQFQNLVMDASQIDKKVKEMGRMKAQMTLHFFLLEWRCVSKKKEKRNAT